MDGRKEQLAHGQEWRSLNLPRVAVGSQCSSIWLKRGLLLTMLFRPSLLRNFTASRELDSKLPLNSTPSHSFGERIISTRLLAGSAVDWSSLTVRIVNRYSLYRPLILLLWTHVHLNLCGTPSAGAQYKKPKAQEIQINKENIKSEGRGIVFNNVVLVWWSLSGSRWGGANGLHPVKRGASWQQQTTWQCSTRLLNCPLHYFVKTCMLYLSQPLIPWSWSCSD